MTEKSEVEGEEKRELEARLRERDNDLLDMKKTINK